MDQQYRLLRMCVLCMRKLKDYVCLFSVNSRFFVQYTKIINKDRKQLYVGL